MEIIRILKDPMNRLDFILSNDLVKMTKEALMVRSKI